MRKQDRYLELERECQNLQVVVVGKDKQIQEGRSVLAATEHENYDKVQEHISDESQEHVNNETWVKNYIT